MKKITVILSSILILFFGLTIFLPNLVNWNEYKNIIEDKIKDRTGRTAEIRGDIKLELLPSPAIWINDVRIKNINQSKYLNQISIKAVEARINIMSMFNRQIQIKKLRIVEPSLRIEKYLNNQTNMFISPNEIEKVVNDEFFKGIGNTNNIINNSQSTSKITPSFLTRIDDFIIVDGSIEYYDHNKVASKRIDQINSDFAVASLSGPMTGSGVAVFQGVKIKFNLDLGEIVKDRTLPLNVKLSSVSSNSKFEISGAVTKLNSNPQLSGSFRFEDENLSKFIGLFNQNMTVSRGLEKSVNVSGKIKVTNESFLLSKLLLNFDGVEGIGLISGKFSDNLDLRLKLEINEVDYDSFLKAKDKPKQVKTKVKNESEKKASLDSVKTTSGISTNINELQNFKKFNLEMFPKDMRLEVDLSIGSLTYNNERVQQVKINLAHEDKEIIFNQVSALLPGSADFGIQGIMRNDEKSKTPKFFGSVDLATNSPNILVKWLGLDLPGIRVDRLKKFNLNSKLEFGLRDAKLSQLKAKVDKSVINGSISAIFQEQPIYSATLNINKLNFDEYYIGSSQSLSVKGGKQAKVKIDKPLNSVRTFDVKNNQTKVAITQKNPSLDLKINIKSLILQNLRVKNLQTRAKVINNDLTLIKLETSDIAGLKVSASGRVLAFLGSFNQAFENLNFDISGKNLKKIIRVPAFRNLDFLDKVRKFRLRGMINGKYHEPKVRANLSILGGSIGLNGIADFKSLLPTFEGKLSLNHRNLSKLIQSMKGKINSSPQNIGDLNIKSRIKADILKVTLSDISGRVANVKFNGKLSMRTLSKRPSFRLNLKTGSINIDKFQVSKPLIRYIQIKTPSVQRIAFKPNMSGFRNNSTKIVIAKNTAKNAKSLLVEHFDFSFLKKINLELEMLSKGIQFQKYNLKTVKIKSSIKNGILNIRDLNAKVYDGLVSAAGTMSHAGKLRGKIKIAKLNIGKLMRANGIKGIDTGYLNLNSTMKAEGSSLMLMAEKLDGKGSLTIKNLQITESSSKKSAIQAISKLLLSLQRFSQSLNPKSAKILSANINTNFFIKRGILSYNDLTLNSILGNGSAKGAIDLPKWMINTSGQIKLAPNLLTSILLKNSQENTLLPFSIVGNLNNPNIDLKTSALTKGGIKLPGSLNRKLEKLLKKKGVGTILEQIIPLTNSNNNQSKNSNKKTNAETKEKIRKPEAEDVIKGILKGLFR
ncbi:MAG: AsmA family protein [Rhodospirillales bacterium]